MSGRRLAAVARAEVAAGLASPLLWVLVLAAVGFTLAVNPAALVPSGDAAIGGVRPQVNAPLALAQVFALAGFLLYTFLAALLAGLAVIRDEEAGIGELLHATPLTPVEYVLGKLAGVLALLAGVLVLQGGVAVALFELGASGGGAALRGPFRPLSYLVAMLAFAAPTIAYCTGVALYVGERTRRPLAVGAVPTVLFVVTLGVLWAWTPIDLAPWLDRLLVVLDPSGVRWLRQTVFAVDRGVAFYDRSVVPFDGWFLLNRGLTLVVPALAVAASIAHCRRRVRGRLGTVVAIPEVLPEAPAASSAGSGAAGAAPGLRALCARAVAPRPWPALMTVAGAELREALASPALLGFAALVVLLGVEAASGVADGTGAPGILTAGRMATASLLPVSALGCLLLLFVVVEAFVRERATGMASLLLATPIGRGALVGGKALAALVVAGATSAAIFLGCLGVLGLAPGSTVEVGPLALVQVLLLPTWLAWIGSVAATIALVRDRYAAYAVGLVALAATALALQRGALTWVTNWPLWSRWRWSDFGPSALDGRALVLNRALVLAVAAVLLALAVGVLERRERDGLRLPLVCRMGRPALGLLVLTLPALALATVVGREIAGGFAGAAVERRAKESWRRHLATWVLYEPPTIERVELTVDLEPAGRRMQVDGFYLLNPRGATPSPVVPFTVGAAMGAVDWSAEGVAVPVEHQAGLDLVRLPPPVVEGGYVRVDFAYQVVHPRGLSRNGGGVHEYLLPSAVRFGTRDGELLPIPGFDPRRGIDRGNRYQAPDPEVAAWLATLPDGDRQLGRFTTRVTITAPTAYVATATGNMVAETTADGRTRRVWESRQEVTALDVTAARWAVARRPGVAVFHHPAHDANVEPMLATLAAARERYGAWLDHPYPWDELRLQEVPDHHLEAVAYPTNVTLAESMGFLARAQHGLPAAFVVVAHEAAHQWWPHLVPVADGPGAGVLIEGMAHFLSLLLAEAEHGPAARQALARWMEAEYLAGRRIDAERPLRTLVERTAADEAVAYHKGAWALWMLYRQLALEPGAKPLAAVVRESLDRGRPVTVDRLLEVLALWARDRETFRLAADQWFGAVVLPEIRLAVGAVRATGTEGEHVVEVEVENVGTGTVDVVLAASRGEPTAAVTPAGVATGAVAAPALAPGPGYQEVRAVVRLTPGVPRRVTLRAPFAPERLVADPDVELLQLHRARARVDL